MRSHVLMIVVVCVVLVIAASSHAEIRVVADHHANDFASPAFQFATVPLPSQNDAATKAVFTLLDGRRDRNGGELDALHDGKVPMEEDQPGANFFFSDGVDGGRILVDLGGGVEVKQVNTYSWHPGTRGPQVYVLYAAEGSAEGFDAQPKKDVDPATCGWTLIARVDARPQRGDAGGQYGVGISDSAGLLGKFRYLLFDVSRTEADDPFGNTFFSEIDVVDPTTPPAPIATGPADGESRREVVEAEKGKYRIALDTTETPDLTEWTHKELAPVVKQWYPKIVKLLASEGYEAPTQVGILFIANMQGVAATGGTRIRCAAPWFRQNLQGEAKGAIVHELVHVVQNYGLARRNNPNAARTPGWVVEGIADYIRWFLYEPQTRGAEITARGIDRARYDGNYRISANFLNWVATAYDKGIVAKLNAAAREGKYSEDLWKEATGRTVQERGDEWKASLRKKIAAEAGQE